MLYDEDVYFALENIDCLKLIKRLKTKYKDPIIDLVIADPPYNISKRNNFKTINRNGIDFGLWDYKFNQTKWISKIAPLIKNNGSIIIFNDYKNLGQICKQLIKSGFDVKDLIRWVKTNPMPRNTNRRYITNYELAIWATKKGKWTFNKPKDLPYLRPEIKTSILTNGKNKIHPTQKSGQLLKQLIATHTNKGDLIFDPFMGSCSTGLASIENQRFFIGLEINDIYFKSSQKIIFNLYKTINNNQDYIIRSPLYYLGDKYKLISQIINLIPNEIDCFYDIFGGGGTMIANINAKQYHYNDNDSSVYNLFKMFYQQDWSVIDTKILNIIQKFNLAPGNIGKKQLNKDNYNKLKDFFNKIKDKTNDSYYHLLALIIFGFNSQIRFNDNNLFNIPIGKQGYNKKRQFHLKKFSNSLKLKNIKTTNLDFEKLEKSILKNKTDKVFLYLAPPYFISNATYNKNWKKEDDHRLFAFLDRLNNKKILWALSNVFESNGKTNKDLITWAAKYQVHYLKHSYQNSNYQKKNKNIDKEVLITNYVVR